MAQQVVAGALLMCPFGAAPAPLGVLPVNKTMCGGVPAANIMDNKPFVNIPTFGVCMSIANPTVAAATAAALGVLTPMPCIPNTVAPWVPGSPTTLVGGMPALNSTSKCMCLWGGAISITFPGQVQTNIA